MHAQPQSLRFPLIKVCGITRIADVEAVAKTKANAIGLNFVPESPRCLDVRTANSLSRCARQHDLAIAAVVRNLDEQLLLELLSLIDVDWVQLHGDESPGILTVCGSRPVIKAISWTGRPREEQLVAAWRASYDAGPHVSAGFKAFLVDAYAPQQGGGTGRVAQWDLLWPRPQELDDVPLILAGGLHAGNVAEAIQHTRCLGVDTASGVETSPGVKSAELLLQFAHAASQAFQAAG
jgi:phosphoribosylanthranilate isomerase